MEFKNYLESRNPEIRADWLDYLGLSETKASEIVANCSSNYGSKTELEKLNAYASIAAITEHGEKYRKGVDNIHVKNLGNARDLDDRIRLHVWRHILKTIYSLKLLKNGRLSEIKR